MLSLEQKILLLFMPSGAFVCGSTKKDFIVARQRARGHFFYSKAKCMEFGGVCGWPFVSISPGGKRNFFYTSPYTPDAIKRAKRGAYFWAKGKCALALLIVGDNSLSELLVKKLSGIATKKELMILKKYGKYLKA
ncbi:MAG: hypothetical protein WC523_03800 [Patescibacteria group bacterium]